MDPNFCKWPFGLVGVDLGILAPYRLAHWGFQRRFLFKFGEGSPVFFGLDMEVAEKSRALFGSSCNENRSVLGSIWGPPFLATQNTHVHGGQ